MSKMSWEHCAVNDRGPVAVGDQTSAVSSDLLQVLHLRAACLLSRLEAPYICYHRLPEQATAHILPA